MLLFSKQCEGLPGRTRQSEATRGAPPWERRLLGTAGVSPASGPTTKCRGFRSLPYLLDPPWPAQSRQDAGAPSVPGLPARRLPRDRGRLARIWSHNKVPWLQESSLPYLILRGLPQAGKMPALPAYRGSRHAAFLIAKIGNRLARSSQRARP